MDKGHNSCHCQKLDDVSSRPALVETNEGGLYLAVDGLKGHDGDDNDDEDTC